MGRKVIPFFLGIITFFCSSIFSVECPFCSEEILTKQKVYETETALVLYTHKPIVESHLLILPKRHVQRFEDLSAEENKEMFLLVQQVNEAAKKAFGTAAYFILQKNGEEVGQTVPHVHFHYVGRKKGDKSTLAMIWKMAYNMLRPPIKEALLRERAERVAAYMSQESLRVQE